MKKLIFTFAALSLLLITSCKKGQLDTVPELDLTKYIGLWYEISRLPVSFEKDLKCVTATYTARQDGKIDVLNQGTNIKTGNIETAKGIAYRPDAKNKPGEIRVSFFQPFYGDYYVIAVGENYEYSLVGSPDKKTLWVLSRTKVMDEGVYQSLLQTAKSKGFDVSKLEKTTQDCAN